MQENGLCTCPAWKKGVTAFSVTYCGLQRVLVRVMNILIKTSQIPGENLQMIVEFTDKKII